MSGGNYVGMSYIENEHCICAHEHYAKLIAAIQGSKTALIWFEFKHGFALESRTSASQGPNSWFNEKPEANTWPQITSVDTGLEVSQRERHTGSARPGTAVAPGNQRIAVK